MALSESISVHTEPSAKREKEEKQQAREKYPNNPNPAPTVIMISRGARIPHLALSDFLTGIVGYSRNGLISFDS